MRNYFSYLFALALLALAACSGAALLNATIPREGYTLDRDIAYGPDPRQHMDIYVPDGLAAPTPVVLFFYGGRWESGRKEDYRFVGQALASKGFVTVIADYRLYPQVRFPAFVQDGAEALRFVHEHIGTYRGDARNIFVAGHSAGAFIAVMLVADDTYLSQAGGSGHWIRGGMGLAGPYDFTLTDDIKPIFSDVPEETTQPVHFMTRKLPPLFLATGDADTTVKPRNTLEAAERLRALNSPVEVHVYEGVAHLGLILSLADGFRSKAPLLDDITRFIHASAQP